MLIQPNGADIVVEMRADVCDEVYSCGICWERHSLTYTTCFYLTVWPNLYIGEKCKGALEWSDKVPLILK